ncbi:decaprenyl-diphosphate synthase subunit 1 isoform X1 [Phyllopteryx taeniolatus]|uniref:decaprenyl-diphosphate synthase subunit 1 isoform X1 n=1 Tax=Phyllopteryx taeniolatus TaxID=161469 RepID=UPI002AD4A933|nr:decaprenyl-diphosphate synthase subunit 1 isoform X1 [Phyllopteryx taeniolatus]
MANMAAGPLWRRCLRWTVSRAAASLREAEWHLFRLRSASGAAASPGRASCKRWRPDELPYLQLNKKILQRSTCTSLARHKYPRCSCRTIHSDAKPKDPFTLAQKDLKSLYDDIKKELFVSKEELKSLCDYYFDGKGKAIRPMIVILMARALNIHSNRAGELLPGQRAVAMISEMIHTASLVHDDVIDGSDERRGKRTINHMWGERKAILVGDFILSAASTALARIGDIAVVKVLAQVTEDLVRGEFMQLGSKENESERFKHYLDKTFKKTASLIANSCKAVCTFCLHNAPDSGQTDRHAAERLPVCVLFTPCFIFSCQVSILVSSDPDIHEIAFQYGRNVGIAFQLVDDVLDFTAGASQLGKPSAADLKLGLATGPVLFACQQFPELHAMIMRRFSSKGDVDRAWGYVIQSDGVEQTNFLARRYCQEAVRHVSRLRPSAERDALIALTHMVLARDK